MLTAGTVFADTGVGGHDVRNVEVWSVWACGRMLEEGFGLFRFGMPRYGGYRHVTIG